ncbi:MAG TPA: PEPxxWA-CTERM sorting domain-containing protein [Croceibacterium sp.]|nr:PEPxxWA-CTERM sorting domain-containing protein [Croceibacterium sp.]
MSLALVAGAAATAALVPSKAEAVVPVATWGGFVSVAGPQGFPDNPISSYGNHSVSSPDGSASVQSVATPLPAITSTATANADAYGSEAFAYLWYYFAISGPASSSLSVNVFANGSLFSDVGTTLNPMQSTDFLRVAGSTIVNATSLNGNNNGAFSTSQTLTGLIYDQPYFIEMNVTAIARPSGTATSFLDPYLSLDPSLVAQGYSIITSEGIGNSLTVNSAVPEPSTWAMMLFGFGGIGFAMRTARRRQKLTVSYA